MEQKYLVIFVGHRVVSRPRKIAEFSSSVITLDRYTYSLKLLRGILNEPSPIFKNINKNCNWSFIRQYLVGSYPWKNRSFFIEDPVLTHFNT